MFNPYIITPASTPAIPLADVKLHVRLTTDDTSQDSVLTRLTDAAYNYCGTALQRSLLATSFGVKFNSFYDSNTGSMHAMAFGSRSGFSVANTFLLPSPPLISVDSITYVDPQGSTQTLSSSNYVVDTWSICPRVFPKYGTTWPTTLAYPNSVTVNFTAGYSTIPYGIQSAMLCLISHWYQNRESVLVASAGVSVEIAQTIDAMLSPYQWGHSW